MSDNSQKAYRHIIKATSIFGGVQVFNIIISLLRSKITAIIIGPSGMGIVGLLNSTINLIGGVTNFGLETSAVKDISFSNNENNENKILKTISILFRLVWCTGILGMISALILSPWLSYLSFGSYEFTFAFAWISISLLFKQLTSGNLAVLQGLRKHKYLAKSNLYGNGIGLLVTIPLYYYCKLDAIVPVIIISSVISLFFSWIYFEKLGFKIDKINNRQALNEGKEMLKLGYTLSITGLLVIISTYVVQIYVSNIGGVDQVGLFNAGFVIINSYVSLIFNAMGTDYYPRLAQISKDNDKIRMSVNQQAFVGVLLITPIIILFIILMPYIIKILYSLKFIPIIKMVSWGILGMFFKAVSWSMGYVLIAKGDAKIFIKTSIGFNSFFILINILGYYYYGLEGLGISFLIYYLIHLIVLKVITKKRYDFYFDNTFHRIFFLCLILCVSSYMLTFIQYKIVKYWLMLLLWILSVVFSFLQLDKRIGIREMIKQYLKK